MFKQLHEMFFPKKGISEMQAQDRESVKDIIKLEEKNLAVFCGAGISINSGLPMATGMMKYIMNKLNIGNRHIEKFINSGIPFEAFMEMVLTNSDDLRMLDLFMEGIPNTNHLLIAKLAKYGFIRQIFTTNFDLLLEKALEAEGLNVNKDFKVFFQEESFTDENLRNNEDKISIFKIHGSIGIDKDKQSIRTILSQIALKQLSRQRNQVIRTAFSTGSHKKILVLGYSCSDSFDLSPAIEAITGDRKDVILIDHSGEFATNDLESKRQHNPFRAFQGKWIKCHTDLFVRETWNLAKMINNDFGEYSFIEAEEDLWKKHIDIWDKDLQSNEGYRRYICGTILLSILEPTEAMKNFEDALRIYSKKNEFGGMGATLNSMGLIHHHNGDQERAILSYSQAAEIFEKIGDLHAWGNNLALLGMLLRNKGDYKQAALYLIRALDIAQKSGDKHAEIGIYDSLGEIYFQQGKKDDALNCYQKSLDLIEHTGLVLSSGSTYYHIAEVYERSGSYDEALKQFQKALDISIKVGHIQVVVDSYHSIATLHLKATNYAEAEANYKNALKFCENYGFKKMFGKCYHGLGMAQQLQSKNSEAIANYQKALEIFRKIPDEKFMGMILSQLGQMHAKTGNDYEAIRNCVEAMIIFSKINDPNINIPRSILTEIRGHIPEEKFMKIMSRVSAEMENDGKLRNWNPGM